MADQPVKDSGVTIKEVVNTQWQKGKCPPDWRVGLIATTQLEPDTEMEQFG